MRAAGAARVLWWSLLAAALLAGCRGGSDAPAGAAGTPTANTPPVLTGTPAASVIDYVLLVLSWVIGFAIAYHSIRQLGLISRIYTRHTNAKAAVA